jgi:hypothetical protein
MRTATAVLAAAGLLAASGAVAHEGHAHKLMGTVTAVDASRLEVETTDGKKTAVDLTPQTKYFKGKATAAAADLEAGRRVVVTTVEANGRVRATEVRIGVAKPAPGKADAAKPPQP